MRKTFSILWLLMLTYFVNAQRTAPFAYSSNIPVNYVRTWDAKAPQTDVNKIQVTSPLDSFVMTTQYLDGLGRPIQTVVKGITPLGKDLVTPVVYDEFGREQYKYLPFAANTTGGNSSVSDGLFKLNPFQQDSAFYQTNNTVSPIKGQNETWFYSQSVFEASPLNRVVNSYAPGNSWVGNSIGIGQSYLINTASDSVRIWIPSSTVSRAPTTSDMYAAGELYKNVTTDENGKQVIEYKDKEGKVVLKKVQLSDTPGTAHVGWLCTYYVYDDLGNLRFVLQPKAVETIMSTWTISDPVRDELCFYYGYDARNRMTTKKVPGSGEVWMIYDSRDRLAYSQDANMRIKNWWLTTVYDALNRQVLTAMMTNSGGRDSLQRFADNATNLSGNTTVTIQGTNATPSLSFSVRESGRTEYKASESIEFRPGFESETNAEFTAEIVTAAGSSSSYTAMGNTFPSGASYKALTQTYYDDYTQAGKSFSTLNNSKLTNSSNFFPEPLPSSPSQQTKGLITSTKVWVMEDADLTSGKWLETVSFYNDKARVIQTQSDNVADGKDTLTSLYDFSGKLLCTYIAHSNPGSSMPSIRVKTNTQYDPGGRIINIIKGINDLSSTGRVISEMTYDELGQLKHKQYYKGNGGTVLETFDYDYNIRGWMLGANRDYAKSPSSTSNYFGFDLGYDKTSIAPTGGSSIGTYTAQLNGNIGGMVWKSTGDDEIRKYDFVYDAVNRLVSADFNQYTSSSFNKTAKLDFSVNLTYDANGNIQTMNQKGWKVGGSVTIDSLAYGYNATSNKLNYVTDRANDVNTKLGDFKETNNNTSQDYSYDGNGNMYIDNNKDIGNIHYNHLNLPDSITVTGKGTIQYVYDAAGNKLKKITKEGTKLTTTIYLYGNYVNDTLQYLPQEEGRIRYNQDSSRFEYDYFVKDHLGNVRMVLTEANKTDKYPLASMEIGDSATENAVYYNLNATRYLTSSISNYPANDGTTNPNDYVAKTNGSGNKIGPAIILKVMAGDKMNVRATDWYNLNGSNPSTPNSPVTDLVSALTNSIGGVTGGKATITELTSSGALNPGILSFYNTHNSADSTTKPKAFLNWIAFDEQMNYVSSSSGFIQVGASNQSSVTPLQQNDIAIAKNGYFYVYVSNETPNINVFFDNLSVTHVRGPLLEETHYYPFGLTMQGISSKAIGLGGAENKIKFQGQEFASKEFSDGSGLDMYEFKYRMDDPQTGRFWQVDPLADDYVYNSPYAFSENRVTSSIELEGLEAKDLYNELGPIREERAKHGIPKSESTGEKVLDANLAILGFLSGGALAEVGYGFINLLSNPKIIGGRKGDIETIEKFDRHEMPSAQSMRDGAGVKTDDVPAVRIPTKLHAKTETFGGSSSARAARALETKEVRNGNAMGAFKKAAENLKKVAKTAEGKQILNDAGTNMRELKQGIKDAERVLRNAGKIN
ncbi:MAG TPA: DUF6443 domain-containing protein [Flavisolibacter sp.]|jgi:RHS repeat-associated protein|nr:DUF6443 domain-containing protein [Flavisolibacter sp.]